MSLETWQAKYPVDINNNLYNLNLREILDYRKEYEPKSFMWSARLSTGIFGLPGCKSGNSSHAPKGENEVVLAMGNEGLSHLIKLGFIPCPTCHPENTKDFWEKATPTVSEKYPFLEKPEDFADKNIVGFDARAVNWEVLAPYLTLLPNRLYVPEDLDVLDLQILKDRFNQLSFKIPPVGYYVNGAPWFKEYKLP